MSRGSDQLSRLAKYALFVAIASLCSRASAADGMSRTILDASGFWRIHYMLRPPVVKTAAGLQTVAQPRCLWLNRDTTPPPDDWRSVDFDDSSWWRSPGAVFPVRRLEWLKLPDLDFGFSDLDYSTVYLAHLAMRGKFAVPDPAQAGDLSLSLAYRGGVVVYLNGKEVARGDMPEGEIHRDTLANDYPPEAFEAAGGKLLSAEHREGDRARCELHNRKLKDVTISARLLRKGLNVLAISVHRAPHHEVVLRHQSQKKPFLLLWSTCGLSSVRLDARGEVVPNCARPRGLQAWNSNPLAVDFDLDWGDPQEKLAAIRLVAARNGVVSGKVVLGATEPVRKLSAKISDLASNQGAKISAARVLIRYATADRWENGASQHYPAAVAAFDGLEETPPAEVEVRAKKAGRGNWILPGQPPHVDGAVQPVWITLKVPADARPGDYAGQLEIAASGRTFRVPLGLHVCPWRVPDPQHFASFCELVQSPETVALEYHVPFWSEQHFALIGRSLSFLGQVGAPTTYLPVVCRTNMGNDYSLVRWIRQPGGGYRHDYALLEKYLDEVVQHQGMPKIVCIYIWDYHCNDGEIPVTGLSADGTMETIHLPRYSDPQSVELWKPLIAGIRDQGAFARHALDRTQSRLGGGDRGAVVSAGVLRERVVIAFRRGPRGKPALRLEPAGPENALHARPAQRRLPGDLSVSRRDQRGWRPARIRPAGRRLLARLARQQGTLRRHARHALQFLAQPGHRDVGAFRGQQWRHWHAPIRDAARGHSGSGGPHFHREGAAGKENRRGAGRALSDNPGRSHCGDAPRRQRSGAFAAGLREVSAESARLVAISVLRRQLSVVCCIRLAGPLARALGSGRRR
ncbi:MAG: glycoside hydrolase domain-containing protein [Thermoguttaceae bacterium]